MKRRIINTFGVILLMLLMSCVKNDDEIYSLGKIWISMGLIETEETLGYDFIIYCDNGDTLYPAANAVPSFKPYDNQRVVINYTILDEVGKSAQAFYAKINNLYNVLIKEPVLLTNENTDSLGNDPVVIKDIWIVNNMLNIKFQYKGGPEVHFINLAYQTNGIGEIEKPVELEFKHNAIDDEKLFLIDGLVTFQLNKLEEEGQNTIEFVVKSFDYNEEEHTFTGTYNY